MLPNFTAISLGVLLLTLQSSSVFPDIAGMGGPDLYICLVAHLGLKREIAKGAVPLIVVGLLADIYAAAPTGLNMVTSAIIFLLLQLSRVRLAVLGLGSSVVFAVLASAVSSLLLWMLASIFVSSFDGSAALLRFAIPRALLTAPFAVPILWLMDRCDRWGQPGKSHLSQHLSFKAIR